MSHEKDCHLSAEDSLPDRQRFMLTPDRWEQFEEALSAPSRSAPRLDELLNQPSVFEKGNL